MFSPSTIGCLTNWLVPQTGSQQKRRLGKCFYFMPYHVKIDKCKKNKAHKLRSKFIRFKFIRHLSESRVCCLSRIHTPLRDIHGTSVLKAVISWSAQSDLPEVRNKRCLFLTWFEPRRSSYAVFLCGFSMLKTSVDAERRFEPLMKLKVCIYMRLWNAKMCDSPSVFPLLPTGIIGRQKGCKYAFHLAPARMNGQRVCSYLGVT